MNSNLKYRKNVALVVLNDLGEILACRRADEFKTWQLPQGGVDEGETHQQAARRELREEIGTDDVELIGHLPHAIKYDWPVELQARGFCGQEQHYFLFRLRAGARIDLNAQQPPEFEQFLWLGANAFLERVQDFRRGAYLQAIGELRRLFPGVIAE